MSAGELSIIGAEAYHARIAGRDSQRVGNRETNESFPLRKGEHSCPQRRTIDITSSMAPVVFHSAEWFHAETDEDAVAQIEAKRPDGTCEIWQGRRLVAKVSPMRLQA